MSFGEIIGTMADDNDCGNDKYESDSGKPEKMFTLKKWNAVAMWSWDVECDICAICRVQVMGKWILLCYHVQLESGEPI